MKIYLAAAFSRQQEIKEIACRLRSKGIIVTSRWLWEKENRLENAFMDVRDLRDADILVRFTDNPTGQVKFQGFEHYGPMVPAKLISGARMFEFGMAWERGMPIFVVGGKQNIFDELPNVIHVNSVSELEERLGL